MIPRTAFELPGQSALPFSVEVLANPTQAQLRELALQHTPFCYKSAAGSVCKVSRNKSRVAQYTYVIDRNDTPAAYSSQTIEPAKAAKLIEGQAEYIRRKGKLIAIEGYVGLGDAAVACQWLFTLEAANIAGMQQVLAFPRSAVESPERLAKPFQPVLRLIYTPDHFVDMLGRQAVLCDLDNYTTYVMGPDYFGESKKGALRMAAASLYASGGLLMHSGAKAIRTRTGEMTMAVLGLSGTGKTTTTFSKQGEATRPIQDDMIAIWAGGRISITENGCFAKTFGLSEATEPALHRGTCHSLAWLENVFVDDAGKPDFFKKTLSPAEVARLRDVLIGTGAPADNVDRYLAGEVSAEQVIVDGVPQDGWDFVQWSENGRSIIPMRVIEDVNGLHDVPILRSLGILNRDEGKDAGTPGLVRFTSPEQAAGYFMLGETTKTSAAGKDRGKTRSPFTQPFFPLAHSLQAKRFSELAATFQDTSMWLMNTGYVGGLASDVDRGNALKVQIAHSSAMLEALISGQLEWTRDPDFGYDVVDVDAPTPANKSLLAKVPAEILQPRRLFEQRGRTNDYRLWVDRMKREREEFLGKYEVEPAIVAAVLNR